LKSVITFGHGIDGDVPSPEDKIPKWEMAMTGKACNYYATRGFSVYYLANAIFNIVSSPMTYMRGIEEILGDMRVLILMRPFHKYTNLHHFIRAISTDILTEDIERGDGEVRFVQQFLDTYEVPFPTNALEDEDQFWEFAAECSRFEEALDEIADEVFHVLFNDVGFLQAFNRLCAGLHRGFRFRGRIQDGYRYVEAGTHPGMGATRDLPPGQG
jgi:hypothetical protein